MNEEIMRKAGFNKKIEAVKQGLCPFCHKPITKTELEKMDSKSFHEYKISGICQKCQDKTFRT